MKPMKAVLKYEAPETELLEITLCKGIAQASIEHGSDAGGGNYAPGRNAWSDDDSDYEG